MPPVFPSGESGGDFMPPISGSSPPFVGSAISEPSGSGPTQAKVAGSVTFQIVRYSDKYTDIDNKRELLIDLCSSSPSVAATWTPLKTGNIDLRSIDGRALKTRDFSGYDTNFPKVSDNLIKAGGPVPINAGCTGRQRWALWFDDPTGAPEPRLASVKLTSDEGESVTFSASEIPAFVLLSK